MKYQGKLLKIQLKFKTNFNDMPMEIHRKFFEIQIEIVNTIQNSIGNFNELLTEIHWKFS